MALLSILVPLNLPDVLNVLGLWIDERNPHFILHEVCGPKVETELRVIVYSSDCEFGQFVIHVSIYRVENLTRLDVRFVVQSVSRCFVVDKNMGVVYFVFDSPSLSSACNRLIAFLLRHVAVGQEALLVLDLICRDRVALEEKEFQKIDSFIVELSSETKEVRTHHRVGDADEFRKRSV